MSEKYRYGALSFIKGVKIFEGDKCLCEVRTIDQAKVIVDKLSTLSTEVNTLMVDKLQALQDLARLKHSTGVISEITDLEADLAKAIGLLKIAQEKEIK